MSMQRGVIVSVALHSGVALAFAMGLTLSSKPIAQKMVEVPVEIVRFAPDSNPPPGKKPVPKEDRKPDSDKSTADKAPSARKREDLKQAKLKAEETRPAPKKPTPKPTPTPKAVEKPKPGPKPEPKPKAVETPKPAPAPKPVKKAEAKPKPAPKKPDPPKREERKVASARPTAPDRKAEAKPKPKPEPKPDPKPPEKAPEAKKEPEKKPEAKPKPVKKAEAKPKPKPKPVKKAETKPKPAPRDAKAKPTKRQVAAARPKAKAGAPKRAPKPKAGTNFDSILKSVDNMRTKRDANRNQTRAPAPRGSKDNVRSRPLTISEVDAVRRQIRPCWNFPSGAKNAQQLRVQVRVWMNRDGTVQKAQILERGRMSRDSFFRAAALAAYRAVKNPRCGPLKLPREKFDRWKVMVIEFDPSEMGDGL